MAGHRHGRPKRKTARKAKSENPILNSDEKNVVSENFSIGARIWCPKILSSGSRLNGCGVRNYHDCLFISLHFRSSVGSAGFGRHFGHHGSGCNFGALLRTPLFLMLVTTCSALLHVQSLMCALLPLIPIRGPAEFIHAAQLGMEWWTYLQVTLPPEKTTVVRSSVASCVNLLHIQAAEAPAVSLRAPHQNFLKIRGTQAQAYMSGKNIQ